MTGLWSMLGKELREQWRTRRLPIVAIVFLLFGIASPILTYYLPDLIEAIGTDGMVIELPPPTTREAVLQFQDNLSQTAILAAILLAMGAVAGERERGVAVLLLTKPLARSAYLLAKMKALTFTLLVGMVMAAVGGYAYTAWLFDAPSAAGYALLTLFLLLPALLFGLITFAGSAVTGSVAGAAGVGIASLILVGLASLLPALAEWLPSAFTEPAIAAALGQTPTDWLRPLVFTVVGIGLATVVAIASFQRQELV